MQIYYIIQDILVVILILVEMYLFSYSYSALSNVLVLILVLSHRHCTRTLLMKMYPASGLQAADMFVMVSNRSRSLSLVQINNLGSDLTCANC